MKCPQCGNENALGAIMCGNCGATLSAPPGYGQPPPGAPQAYPPQQAPYGGIPQIPTYLVHAILVTLFCCVPFGIVAIVYAAQVSGKLQAGDYQGALDSSGKARMWCWISFGLGLAAILIGVVANILVGVSSMNMQ